MAVTQIVGPRIAPYWADPVEWTSTRAYEPFTFVTYQGDSYCSRQDTPIGIDIANGDYWVKVSEYNAQAVALQRSVSNQLEANEESIEKLIAEANESLTETSNTVTENLNKVVSEANTTMQTNVSQVQEMRDEFAAETPFDTVVTQNSTKGVTSGAVYNADEARETEYQKYVAQQISAAKASTVTFVDNTYDMTNSGVTYVLTTSGNIWAWNGSAFADTGLKYTSSQNAVLFAGYKSIDTRAETADKTDFDPNDAVANTVYLGGIYFGSTLTNFPYDTASESNITFRLETIGINGTVLENFLTLIFDNREEYWTRNYSAGYWRSWQKNSIAYESQNCLGIPYKQVQSAFDFGTSTNFTANNGITLISNEIGTPWTNGPTATMERTQWQYFCLQNNMQFLISRDHSLLYTRLHGRSWLKHELATTNSVAEALTDYLEAKAQYVSDSNPFDFGTKQEPAYRNTIILLYGAIGAPLLNGPFDSLFDETTWIYINFGGATGDPTNITYFFDANFNYCYRRASGGSYGWSNFKYGEITVGSGGTYTKLTDAFDFANSHADTTIRLLPGTYDIIEELGGESAIEAKYASQTRSYLGPEIGNGAHIIGCADAKIVANYTGDNEYVMAYFSPIVPMRQDVTFEDVWIEVSKCEYCVHDDDGVSYASPYKHVYKGCHFKNDFTNNTSSIHVTSQCIGGGLGVDTSILIEDCYFESVGPSEWDTNPLSFHSYTGNRTDGQSQIIVTNSYFAGTNATARFSWYGVTAKPCQVYMSGCSVARAPLNTAENASQTNVNMVLTAWNNEIRSN